MKFKRFYTDYLPFASLTFDERVQRALIPARVKAFKADWRLNAGAITVSIRADGKAYVIDGQHRVMAALEMGLHDTKAFCHVYRDLSIEEEALHFLVLNNARSVRPIDLYEVGLTACHPTALGVRDTLTRHGLKVGHGSQANSVRCVTKLMQLYERDPRLLEEVCRTLTEAWGTRSSAFEQIIVAALGTVYGRYDGTLDKGALASRLAKYRGGPASLLGDARGLADYKPISVTRAAAEIMVDTYNKGRRSGQLAPL